MVADEDHNDVVVGAFVSLDDAHDAVVAYRGRVLDAFCWIEQSVHAQPLTGTGV